MPFVGPASTRIVRELVETGRSATVETAVAASAKASDVSQAPGAARQLPERARDAAGARDADLPPTIVSRDAFRGDFQMHSTWSDGAESLPAMIEGCAALGQTCLGITDHSYGLPIAKGMTMETVAGQHAEIDALNEGLAGRFRVFKGIEANILADGIARPGARRAAAFRVRGRLAAREAAPELRIRPPRMLAAVGAPGVAILGHPRGRVFDTRGGVQCDWPRIFAVAAEREVAMELDGNWHRQDLDLHAGRARRSRRAACSRSTATPTRAASCASPTTRSPTPASPAIPGRSGDQLLERRSAGGVDGGAAGAAAFAACT